MPRNSTQGEFTGRHMFMVLAIGFGIVIAVNFFMASVAARSFGGVVVENSYVASQKFNGWLAEAKRERELGWEAESSRLDDGRLAVTIAGVPASATVHASVRRPLGAPEATDLELVALDGNRFASAQPLPEGRWIVRLTIEAAGQQWRQEKHLP
ncbi:FixH family protein [Altererythrobacter sp. BO-6]|uniref:FixH family protein n=1 Tax=Altererythrobacter sp. BO-6 TaxID=2604537 RepID=UPI001F4A0262|nr:FixH family protein [Altererythrobacter sp. BO-6]